MSKNKNNSDELLSLIAVLIDSHKEICKSYKHIGMYCLHNGYPGETMLLADLATRVENIQKALECLFDTIREFENYKKTKQ